MVKEMFTETQRMQKLWFWVIAIDLIVIGCILVFVISKTETDMADILPPLVIVLVAFSVVIWIVTSSKLIVTIDSNGINYRYPVFKPKWKKISKADINTFTIKNYDAIFDYGGWGTKNSKKNGRCVTIQGDTGLFLELKNGERILIGTQDKEGIAWAMKRLMERPSEEQ